MDEISLKTQISAAMGEPSAPQALVERTVVRAEAITAGRAAEQRLAAGETLSAGEAAVLTAKSVAGRLMLTAMPPAGITAEAMASRLAENEKIRQLAALSPEKLLSELQTGQFLSRFRESEAQQSGPSAAPAAEKTAPEIAPPAIQTPQR